jgi:echinoderm microtubule-associated protein-like 6
LPQVKLFNWPCVVQHAPAHVYGGHSSHVMNVRWSADSQYAVSVGGKDRAVFQWRVVREVKKAAPGGLKAPWAVLDNRGVVYGPPPAAANAARR